MVKDIAEEENDPDVDESQVSPTSINTSTVSAFEMPCDSLRRRYNEKVKELLNADVLEIHGLLLVKLKKLIKKNKDSKLKQFNRDIKAILDEIKGCDQNEQILQLKSECEQVFKLFKNKKLPESAQKD